MILKKYESLSKKSDASVKDDAEEENNDDHDICVTK